MTSQWISVQLRLERSFENVIKKVEIQNFKSYSMIDVIWCHRIDKFDWLDYPPLPAKFGRERVKARKVKWDVSITTIALANTWQHV